MLEHRDLTERIIGLAIEVPITRPGVKPGLDFWNRITRLVWPLSLNKLAFRCCARSVPVLYKGVQIPLGFRADLLIAGTVILEINAVPALLPAHEAQLLTYLRISGLPPPSA